MLCILWGRKTGYSYSFHNMNPAFLGIGAQKAGTTWLHRNLNDHPEIWMPEDKELHWWYDDDPEMDRFRVVRRTGTMEQYQTLFKEGEGKVTGEITPEYSVLSVEKIRMLHKHLPDLKILLLLRDPVERAWSAAKMYAKKSYAGEPVPTQDMPPHHPIIQAYMQFFASEFCQRMGDYHQIIENWQSVYPLKQFFIRSHQDIINESAKVIRDVFQFLEVSVHYSPTHLRKRFNVSRPGEMPDVIRDFLMALYTKKAPEL